MKNDAKKRLIVVFSILPPLFHNNVEFRLPNPRIEQLKKFPLYALPYEWNQAGVLTLYPNRTTFKFALKDQLLAEIMI